MATRGRDLHLNVPFPREPPDLLMAESPLTGGLSAFKEASVEPFVGQRPGACASGQDVLDRRLEALARLLELALNVQARQAVLSP
jgi:hypothetical protein